jgi:lipid-A-disaccharide synthase
MLEAASIVAEQVPELQIVVARAAGRSQDEVDDSIASVLAAGRSLPQTLVTVHDETYDALNASDAAAVASGTATLETGIIGTPLVVVYKASGFNFRLVRPLISVEHFGLVNLVAEERIATELIQDDFTPDALAEELLRLLVPETNAVVRERLKIASAKLGQGGASKRAAEAILKLIGANTRQG